MGHSFGGAFTQVLLDRGLGAAGVGIASATVKGIFDPPFSTLKSSSPVLRNPFKKGKAVPPDKRQFHYAFTNTLSEEESDAVYERYHVPAAAPGRPRRRQRGRRRQLSSFRHTRRRPHVRR